MNTTIIVGKDKLVPNCPMSETIRCPWIYVIRFDLAVKSTGIENYLESKFDGVEFFCGKLPCDKILTVLLK